MAHAHDFEADREEFWARRAAERRRRSSSQSQYGQNSPVGHSPIANFDRRPDAHGAFLTPEHAQQVHQGAIPRPRARSDASRPWEGIELGTPLRPAWSSPGDRVNYQRRRASSVADQNLYDRGSRHSDRHIDQPLYESRSPYGHSRRSRSSHPHDEPALYRQSGPTSRASREQEELHRWKSSRSSDSGREHKSHSRHHRSHSGASHDERTAAEIEDNLNRMHPTRAVLRDQKNHYVHGKPMEYPHSNKRIGQVAVGGVAGAAGVAGASEAVKHDSCFGFGDFFDCGDCGIFDGLCDCLGLCEHAA